MALSVAGLEGALRMAACTVLGRGNALLVLLQARWPGAELERSPTGPGPQESKDRAGHSQRSPDQGLNLDQMGQADPLLPKSPPGRVRCSARGAFSGPRALPESRGFGSPLPPSLLCSTPAGWARLRLRRAAMGEPEAQSLWCWPEGTWGPGAASPRVPDFRCFSLGTGRRGPSGAVNPQCRPQTLGLAWPL